MSQYCFPLLLGTTHEETKKNFIVWMNRSESRTAQVAEDHGEVQEGCYERLTCSDLQGIVSLFARLSTWREACVASDCSAGKFYTVTGNESKMKITRQKLGPFL